MLNHRPRAARDAGVHPRAGGVHPAAAAASCAHGRTAHGTRLLACAAFVAFATACGAPAPQTGASDPAADALVSAWIEAAGGEAAWDDARSVRYTVTTVWFDAETGLETRRRPRYVRLRKLDDGFQVRVERQEAEGHYVQVWDGAAAWATLDGETLPDSAAAVIEIPHVAGDLLYWIGLPWKLRDPGVRLAEAATPPEFAAIEPAQPGAAAIDPAATGAAAAIDTAPGAGTRVVEVTFDAGTGLSPGDRYWYYFPDDTPYPVRVDFQKEGLSPAAVERTLWRDWRRTGGMAWVGERLYIDAAGRREKALLFSDVDFNAAVDPADFRRPPRGTAAVR